MDETDVMEPLRRAAIIMREKEWDEFLDRIVAKLRLLCAKVKRRCGTRTGDMMESRCNKARCRVVHYRGGIVDHEDSQCYCDKCGAIIDHCFTDEGSQEELLASTQDLSIAVCANEALTLLNVIDCGNPKFTGSILSMLGVERNDLYHHKDYRHRMWMLGQRLGIEGPIP